MDKSSICLVTGANAGIGLEAAKGLARTGARVVMACRDAAKGEAARAAIAQETKNPNMELLVVDLADQNSIRAAAKEFFSRYSTLDVLVNNAGIASAERLESPQGIELVFATNVLAYHLLTELLMEPLRRASAARIVNVASGMAYGLELDDVGFERRRYDKSAAYAQSKQANRMLTWALARRLKGTSVTVNAMTPGPVSTKLLHLMVPGLAGRTPAQGADTIIWLATSPEVAKVSGKYWMDRREQPCQFQDEAQQEALWTLCDRLTR